MPSSRTLSPETLVARLVQGSPWGKAPQALRLNDVLDPCSNGGALAAEWERLVCRLLSELRPELTREAHVAQGERLQQALPAENRRTFIHFIDAFGLDEQAFAEAGFLLGVQIGRLTAGGGR